MELIGTREEVKAWATDQREKIFSKYQPRLNKLKEQYEADNALWTRKIKKLKKCFNLPVIGGFLGGLFQETYQEAMKIRGKIDQDYVAEKRWLCYKRGDELSEIDSVERYQLATVLHENPDGIFICRHQREFDYCPKCGESMTPCQKCRYYAEP